MAVLGHSLGEIVASCVAGVLSLQDALTLASGRGKAMATVPKGGGLMAAVRGGIEEVQAVLGSAGAEVEIAAVNSPTSVVISGFKDKV